MLGQQQHGHSRREGSGGGGGGGGDDLELLVIDLHVCFAVSWPTNTFMPPHVMAMYHQVLDVCMCACVNVRTCVCVCVCVVSLTQIHG